MYGLKPVPFTIVKLIHHEPFLSQKEFRGLKAPAPSAGDLSISSISVEWLSGNYVWEQPSGAKARPFYWFSARLKSCPVTKPDGGQMTAYAEVTIWLFSAASGSLRG